MLVLNIAVFPSLTSLGKKINIHLFHALRTFLVIALELLPGTETALPQVVLLMLFQTGKVAWENSGDQRLIQKWDKQGCCSSNWLISLQPEDTTNHQMTHLSKEIEVSPTEVPPTSHPLAPEYFMYINRPWYSCGWVFLFFYYFLWRILERSGEERKKRDCLTI